MPQTRPESLPDVDPRDVQLIRHWGHDVRSVLTNLSDHLRLAAQAGVADPGRRNLDAALRQADAMARMIAAALAEMTGGAAEASVLVLDDLLADLQQAYGHPQGPELRLLREADLPEQLGLDRVAVERILRNLVSNALRHAGARQVQVSLGLAGPDRLLIQVRDDGRGFPPHLVAAPQEGKGLGLGIVSMLVEDQGGIWHLLNLPEGGAEVRVLLPFQPIGADVPAPGRGVGGNLAGRRLLAVDDSLTTLQVIAAIGAAEGVRVDCARSGAEALELIARNDYDLLMVDAHLEGDLTGAQVIRALRGSRPLVPALAMTADTTATRSDELITAGASRVLAKPLPDPTELVRIMTRLIQAQARPAATGVSARAATGAGGQLAGGGTGVVPAPDRAADMQPDLAIDPPPEPAADVPLFDPDPLTRVCSLAGPETAREILERLVLDLTETLARLDRAGLPPDLAELRAATHVLIALAGTAGALRLLDRSQALNRAIHAGAMADLPGMIGEIRQLSQSAILAISGLPLPTQPTGPRPS